MIERCSVHPREFRGIPQHARSVLSALHFAAPDVSGLAELSPDQWTRALEFSDRSQLTLPLALRCEESLPSEVRSRVLINLRNNGERWMRLKKVYREIAAGLEEAGIPFLVLKGFAQYPLFVSDPKQRAQYDIDLLLPAGQVKAAAEVATHLGYEPARSRTDLPTDHLPTMIRRTAWNWRGDYFDPGLPFSLELHFRCWDRAAEHFGPENLEEAFWSRSEIRVCEDLRFRGLRAPDSVFYAALHVLRHVLHGNLKAFHVYEMACFLEHHADDDSFWTQWERFCAQDGREEQAIAFRLAQQWFGCRLHPAASSAVHSLAPGIRRWLDNYGDSPLTALFRPSKEELWLHWMLVESRRKRWLIAKRKLLPSRLPSRLTALELKPQRTSWVARVRQAKEYFLFVCKRLTHHLRSVVPTVFSAVHWFGGFWARDISKNEP